MDAIGDFVVGMVGSRLVEWAAIVLLLINVTLIIRRSVWNYPFGLAGVALYCWIFYDYKLYSDSLLQAYYFGIQIFGWVWWVRNRGADGLVHVARLDPRTIPLIALGAVAGAFALGWVMGTYTDAALPYWDATTTVLSVIAQFLLARRFLESWLVWIVVDVLSIGIYVTKGLTPTAALYGVFLVLATIGLTTWWRAWRSGEALPA